MQNRFIDRIEIEPGSSGSSGLRALVPSADTNS
jgi:hypothetical protein